MNSFTNKVFLANNVVGGNVDVSIDMIGQLQFVAMAVAIVQW